MTDAAAHRWFGNLKRAVELGVSAIVFLSDRMQGLVRSLFGRDPVTRCVILYYHGISLGQRQVFARQMDLLLRYARPTACEALFSPSGGERWAGITFDDGLLSYKEVALPEMLRRALPSTVFVPTQYLGEAPGWSAGTTERLMTASEIREIAQNALVTVGSHGVSHRPFTSLVLEEARSELLKSRDTIESITGRRVVLFSFPHGAYCANQVSLARDVGYERIFSILPTLAFRKPDEFVVGRVHVDPFNWPVEFILKVSGAYRWLPRAYYLKQLAMRAFTGTTGGGPALPKAAGKKPW